MSWAESTSAATSLSASAVTRSRTGSMASPSEIKGADGATWADGATGCNLLNLPISRTSSHVLTCGNPAAAQTTFARTRLLMLGPRLTLPRVDTKVRNATA
eukprot:CAMPEP_0115196148 /NCGR_PEP_ID=MMETSP0270-20121206/14939_1 /TAXON_ID=71861 /ORGANISM="Scrippsiella trochoidea, Strain CCMP3099" /LENGTH=100 /DNA_ID=CAMNT_0002609477 /DNA_START=857 /DNA_END=1159 /DNA_ORIENTATION=-